MKQLRAGICILMIILLTGCGDKAFMADTNTLYIKEDGSVSEAVFELFDKTYYDHTELKNYVDEEIMAYNLKAAKEAVKLNQFDVTDQVATVYMDYTSMGDFIAFNQSDFFYGTVKEAMDAQYGFEGGFVKYPGGEEASVLEVTENASYKIFIGNTSLDLRLDENILFTSSNVTGKDKKNVTLTEGELSYIIYK